MWRSLNHFCTPIKQIAPFLIAESVLNQQLRTTFILKRRVPPFLHRKGNHPKPLRSRHYVYELVKDTGVEKQPDFDVILTSFVEGVGNVGERVSVKPHFAYNHLLLPGLAIYATPENIEKYKHLEQDVNAVRCTSKNVPYIIMSLEKMLLSVVMNKDMPWILQPWHIKASFRKCGIIVPEDAIKIPNKEIKGPNMDIEGKEFYVTITINKTEQANVRCRLHHWSTNIVDRLPYEEDFFLKPSESIFPDDKEFLEKLSAKRNRKKQ